MNAVNRDAAKARISLRLATETPNTLSVHGTAAVLDAGERHGAQAYLALYENNLANQVTAGENKGKQLRHDFVVRELTGPYVVEP